MEDDVKASLRTDSKRYVTHLPPSLRRVHRKHVLVYKTSVMKSGRRVGVL